jgi:hypothetical protein
MSAVLNLPPEQQPAAAAAVKAKLGGQGYDVGHLPDAENYSPMAAAMARDMGVDTVVQERRERDDRRDGANDEYRAKTLDIRKAQLGISQQREARASRLPKAPPSVARKGYVAVHSREQFSQLPSGTNFIAPDGSMRIKP